MSLSPPRNEYTEPQNRQSLSEKNYGLCDCNKIKSETKELIAARIIANNLELNKRIDQLIAAQTQLKDKIDNIYSGITQVIYLNLGQIFFNDFLDILVK